MNKHYKIFIRIILCIFFLLATTAVVIHIHTPKPSSLTFDFTCLSGPNSVCPVRVDESKKESFNQTITDSIINSHRLGKLSDVYISLIQFKVTIVNLSTGTVKIGSSTPVEVKGNIQCVNEILLYGQEKEIDKKFVLPDSSRDLIDSIVSYISYCPGFVATEEGLSTVPEVPPNSLLIFQTGPQFVPIFTADWLSWVLVSLFNLILLTGLFPLSREGYRWTIKGSKYFSETK
jgi:hypothetical protein